MTNYYRPDTFKKALKISGATDQKNLPLYYAPRAKNLQDWDADGLIDLSHSGLDQIRIKKNEMLIGSMVSLESLAVHEEVTSRWDGVLSKAVSYTTTLAMRNLATVGGVLVNPVNPPEVTLALLALDAEVVIAQAAGKDVRIPLAAFLNEGKPVLEKGSLIREISIALSPRTHCVMERVARTEKDTPIVSVIIRGDLTRKKAHHLRIAVAGANAFPQRYIPIEKEFDEDNFTLGRIVKVSGMVESLTSPVADFRGSEEYRRAMAVVLIRRGLIQLRKIALTQGTEEA